MKTQLTRFLFTFALAATCLQNASVHAQTSAAAASSTVSHELVEAYVRKSGLDRQIDGLVSTLPDQLASSFNDMPGMTEERKKRMTDAARTVFDVKRMQRAVRTEIGRNARADDIKIMNAFFDTALGKQIVELEAAAAKADPIEANAKAEALAPHFAAQQPARYATAVRLEKALRMTDFVVSMIEHTSIAAIRAAMATSGQNRSFEIDEVRRTFREDNKALTGRLRPIMVASGALIYERLSEAEFDRYVQTLDTPAGARLSDAVAQTFAVLFAQLGAELGRLLGEKSV